MAKYEIPDFDMKKVALSLSKIKMIIDMAMRCREWKDLVQKYNIPQKDYPSLFELFEDYEEIRNNKNFMDVVLNNPLLDMGLICGTADPENSPDENLE